MGDIVPRRLKGSKKLVEFVGHVKFRRIHRSMFIVMLEQICIIPELMMSPLLSLHALRPTTMAAHRIECGVSVCPLSSIHILLHLLLRLFVYITHVLCTCSMSSLFLEYFRHSTTYRPDICTTAYSHWNCVDAHISGLSVWIRYDCAWALTAAEDYCLTSALSATVSSSPLYLLARWLWRAGCLLGALGKEPLCG